MKSDGLPRVYLGSPENDGLPRVPRDSHEPSLDMFDRE